MHLEDDGRHIQTATHAVWQKWEKGILAHGSIQACAHNSTLFVSPPQDGGESLQGSFQGEDEDEDSEAGQMMGECWAGVRTDTVLVLGWCGFK